MTDYFRATLPPGDETRAHLQAYLRDRWTRDVVVTELETRDRYHRTFEIRATRTDMILDGKTGGRTFVLSLGPAAGTITAELTQKGWSLTGPPKRKFFSEFQRVSSDLVQRSENVVLTVAHDKIVEAPLVQQALSPIRNIIVWLDRNGSVDWATLRGLRKPEPQVTKYLRLLEDVGYARREAGGWVQGDHFPVGTSGQNPKEFYDGMLARAIGLGFPYMRQVIGLTQMVGYFFWSNSYFLTALEANKRVALREGDLITRKARYYPSRGQSQIEAVGQMQRVIDTRLLLREDGNVIGDVTKTEEYLDTARKNGIGIA